MESCVLLFFFGSGLFVDFLLVFLDFFLDVGGMDEDL